MDFGKRLAELRKDKNLSQAQLARILEMSPSTISMYEVGNREPDFETEEAIADYFNVDLNYLRGKQPQKNSDIVFPSNILPIPKTKKVPRLGTIACGLPILAEENIETYDSVDENLHCDFTLLCRGDSMLPKLQENDVVLICSQPDVENGQIAAVLIGEEATLKKVHKNENSLILTAENTVYPPMIYTGEQLENISIIGKVVGIIRYF